MEIALGALALLIVLGAAPVVAEKPLRRVAERRGLLNRVSQLVYRRKATLRLQPHEVA